MPYPKQASGAGDAKTDGLVKTLSLVNLKNMSARSAQSVTAVPKGQPATLADRIERIGRALTAKELAQMLSVSTITIFKQAKAGRIPSFHIGTCVRFDPRAVANWLRAQ
jgi:excisionase family DNA binding protein